jgi:hypothetical protein
MLTALLAIIYLFLQTAVPGPPPATTIVSPPIPELDARRIFVRLPTGWRIESQDDTDHWVAHYYEFRVRTNQLHAGKPIVVDCVIDRYAVLRARRDGFLRGRTLNTKAGRVGFLIESIPGTEWHLTVPVNRAWTVSLTLSGPEGCGTKLASKAKYMLSTLRIYK